MKESNLPLFNQVQIDVSFMLVTFVLKRYYTYSVTDFEIYSGFFWPSEIAPSSLCLSDHTKCTCSSHSEELVLGSWSDIESHLGVSTWQTFNAPRSARSPLGSSVAM